MKKHHTKSMRILREAEQGKRSWSYFVSMALMSSPETKSVIPRTMRM